MEQIPHQVAIVTGASSGIGKATAEDLAQAGATVVLAARRAKELEALAARIESTGGTAFAVPTDVTVDDDLVSLVDTVTDRFGRIDILVNVAGFGLYGSVEDTALTDARYQFEVNLFGIARLTQLVLPEMRAHHSGRIINISSMGGRIWTPLGAWYHATKHALEGWSDCLRYEVAPFGIDVVVIEPGVIETEWGGVMVEGLLERSGDGPYADLAQAVAARTREIDEEELGSAPELVASTITKAASTRNPKPRYAVGKYARPLITIRRLGGDRVYDRVVEHLM